VTELLFQHQRAMVFHGDWRELRLPAGSIDVVLTDPPYTEHVQANVRSCSTNGTVKVKEYDLKFDPLVAYDHVPALLEVASRWVLCFCALEQLGDYQRAAGGPRQKGGAHVRSGIWRKQQAAPQLSGDRPANSCEGWALLHRPGGKLKWNGRGQHAFHDGTRGTGDVRHGCATANELEEQAAYMKGEPPSFVEHGRERAEKRHPAQKPAGLCAQLAAWFVNEGDTVLDPYAGSGALGWASFDRGASIVLVDSDREWAEHCASEASRRCA
jgi:hypothetical protein